ncbi:cobalamin-dependent protein [Candidatus Bathycorpusculum sp.]|uniref:B12-binding domain-containing radical SAM protein n=1 Tax=Candidatus Bathycorpusculum sp. TaxID=2994959 RepID=UPI00281916DC|nr:cobalamin-dependent protein [Candidatus Termitimicrobium sp.]MCL2431808.1 cobalamin-dependent protein [Candidatus Termitimicrobium sp.]
MKITLVNPPYPPSVHSHPPFIPLGLGYLAAVAERAGHQVKIIDCQAEKLTYDTFQERITQTPSDFIGVTATTLLYKSAMQILTLAKQAQPSAITAAGGSHGTFWDENTLKEYPAVDLIVRGEGEETLVDLAEKLENHHNLADVLGITYREGDKIRRNPDRPYIKDLDSIPFPAHHLMPLDNLKHNGKLLIPLVSSRGCVYWCDFCSTVRMFGRGYRMRSAKNVVDEMQFVHQTYGVDQVTFYDDAFSVDRERVLQICKELHNRNLKLIWDCGTRVDMVDRELLKTMKDAGCIAVWMGVESGSEAVLSAMNKSIKLEQTRQAYKTAHEVGLMTIANVVLGFPGETEQTAKQTIRFVQQLNPEDVGFYLATPYPGTPMYDLVVKNGWLRVTDFDKYDTAGPIFETPTMSMEKLAQLRYKAYQQFYLRPGYVLHMLRKGGTYGRSAVKTSGAYLLRALHIRLS